MIGSRLAHYEITNHLGSGGMDEVYQATDLKLGRRVAIKLLPEAFARDAERVARFEREARVLASLNHPHIAAIYGLEQSDERRFLVMELAAGETLAARIARGALPLDEALPIASQIAEALEAAHEKGVTHRDLKPANIKVSSDGQVKVLDFGLAKAFAGDQSDPVLSNSPTMNAAATNAGVILGTAAYMSPEQAKGLEVDRRTDIFSFGAVLYEMLTGRQAFPGDTLSDILATVLKVDPDFAGLPHDTPHAIRRLLQRCLQKDRNRRLKSADTVRFDIEEARTAPEPPIQKTPTAPNRERLAWLAALLVVAAVAAILSTLNNRAPEPRPEMRVDIATPPTPDALSLAISPDGRRLVFAAAQGGGQSRLWLRALDSTTAQPLPGTDGAIYPFWSPDSRSIGFFAEAKVKRIDIGGGLPQAVADAPIPRGGMWTAEGSIVFAPSSSTPLLQVSASGGQTKPITKLDPPRQSSHRFPQSLADGRQFLFFVQGAQATQGMYLGSIDSTETTFLTNADTAGVYAPPGWLLFIRQGTLLAQRFDLSARKLTGDPVTVADPVVFDAGVYAGAFSASANGLITFRTGGFGRRQLTWFDRSGKALGTMGDPDETMIGPQLSPDGRRAAIHRTVQNNADIWVIYPDRTTRFTFDANNDWLPIWSPDGSRIVFDSNRSGVRNLYVKPSNGSGSETALVETPVQKSVHDWSRDGRFLLYWANDPKTLGDVWAVPMEGDRKPFPFLNSMGDERGSQFSPDGRWVSYQSNESGRNEIYVRAFPGPGGQWLISTGGGIQARWSRDGKELYYVAPDGKLMAAPVVVKGDALEPRTPVALFQTRLWGGGSNSGWRQQYDVSSDGRFLMNVTIEEAASPITLLLNWNPGK